MKRICLLALCLTMLLSVLASCKKENGDTQTTTEKPTDTGSGEVAGTSYEDLLPDVDYDDAKVNILTSTQLQSFYIYDDGSKLAYSQDVLRRNKLVEERYGVRLNYTAKDGNFGGSELFTTAIRSSYVNGEGAYDIVIPQGYFGVLLALEGCYYDQNRSQYLHLDEDWYYQYINEVCELDGKLFFSAGAYIMDKTSAAYGIYVNQTMFSQLVDGEIDLYQKAREGKWTYEDMITYADGIAADMNHDDLMDANDRYALVGSTLQPFFTGCDIQSVEWKEDGSPSLIFYGDRLINVFDKLYAMVNAKGGGYLTGTAVEARKIFTGGKALFLAGAVSEMSLDHFADMTDTFLLLPTPKYNEAQEHYCTAFQRNDLQMILANTDTDRASIILEALNYQTDQVLIPSYWESILLKRLAEDNNMREMMRLIRASATLDFANIFSKQIGSIYGKPAELIKTKSNTLTSWWEDAGATVAEQLPKLVADYKKLR